MIAAPLPIPIRRAGRGGGPPGAAGAAGGAAGGGNVATPARPAGAGTGKPFVERVPDAEARSQRLRRHTEKVADVLNALMRTGALVQTGPNAWAIDAAALANSGGLTADGRTPGHYGA